MPSLESSKKVVDSTIALSGVVVFSSWCPCHRGEVGRGFCHPFLVFSFLSSHFSHCVLYQQSLTPIFCCCSPFSSHSSQISRNAVLPSHSQSSSPPFPAIFCARLSLPVFLFISHTFHKSILFQSTLDTFS